MVPWGSQTQTSASHKGKREDKHVFLLAAQPIPVVPPKAAFAKPCFWGAGVGGEQHPKALGEVVGSARQSCAAGATPGAFKEAEGKK